MKMVKVEPKGSLGTDQDRGPIAYVDFILKMVKILGECYVKTEWSDDFWKDHSGTSLEKSPKDPLA